MRFSDIIVLKNDPDNQYLDDKEVTENFGFVVIDGYVAFPILTSFSFEKSNDIEIKLPNKTIIGKIKFLKTDSVVEDIHSLSNEEFICFLVEYEQSSIVDRSYKFQNDFLIIHERYMSDYIEKFKSTSPIWGSFFHTDSQPTIVFTQKHNTISIEVVDQLEISNAYYLNNLFLSINEANPFNRFLKLYHLLELQFDMHTAYLIKGLYEQGGKEREISNKLKEYNKDEDERLESLIKERCIDLERIIPFLNNVTRFQTESIKIFYDYGKVKNPLKRADFLSIIAQPDGFNRTNINSLGGYSFDFVIPKLSSYWIYRIRCCVAHNRFGEYVMTHFDEKFVVEFGEPLLKEIITQCFKK